MYFLIFLLIFNEQTPPYLSDKLVDTVVADALVVLHRRLAPALHVIESTRSLFGPNDLCDDEGLYFFYFFSNCWLLVFFGKL